MITISQEERTAFAEMINEMSRNQSNEEQKRIILDYFPKITTLIFSFTVANYGLFLIADILNLKMDTDPDELLEKSFEFFKTSLTTDTKISLTFACINDVIKQITEIQNQEKEKEGESQWNIQ